MCKIILVLSSFVSLYITYLILTSYDCHIEVLDSYKSICYNNGNPYSCIKLKASAKVILRNGTIDNKNIYIECDMADDYGVVVNCTDEYNNTEAICRYYNYYYYNIDITIFSCLLCVYLTCLFLTL